MVGYGCQLGTYDYDSEEIVGPIEHLPDLAKAAARIDDLNGAPVLLVGGRGGHITDLERQLASPGGDTRSSEPSRALPPRRPHNLLRLKR